MSAAEDPNREIKDLRAADARFCETSLPGWRWLQAGFVGQCTCLRCDKTAQVDLSDRPRLAKCVDGCGSAWTLAGLCRDFGWLIPPSAIA